MSRIVRVTSSNGQPYLYDSRDPCLNNAGLPASVGDIAPGSKMFISYLAWQKGNGFTVLPEEFTVTVKVAAVSQKEADAVVENALKAAAKAPPAGKP